MREVRSTVFVGFCFVVLGLHFTFSACSLHVLGLHFTLGLQACILHRLAFSKRPGGELAIAGPVVVGCCCAEELKRH